MNRVPGVCTRRWGSSREENLRAANVGDYTTGDDVSHASDGLKRWLVMVKDTQGRCPSNPLWGDSWGWALLEPDDLAVNAAADYKSDWIGRHVPAKNRDYVSTEAYPTLRSK